MSDTWTPYLSATFEAPDASDRERIESAIGQRLPDAYWTDLQEHQGQTREREVAALANGKTERVGVYLYVVEPEKISGRASITYGLLAVYEGLQGSYPGGVVPFSDDTGGNNFAFDYRGDGEPAIVYVDHNVEGEDGLSRAAPDYAALVANLREE